VNFPVPLLKMAKVPSTWLSEKYFPSELSILTLFGEQEKRDKITDVMNKILSIVACKFWAKVIAEVKTADTGSMELNESEIKKAIPEILPSAVSVCYLSKRKYHSRCDSVCGPGNLSS